MNASLLLGIVIGMATVLVCFGIFLAIPAKRTSKASQNFNEKSLAELTERNAIGHDQRAALWKIAGYLAPKDTREADRKARRERIATAMVVAIPHIGCGADLEPHEFAPAALQFADALIAALDKPSE